MSLKTVQISSRSSELCSSASKRLQISLMNACLLLSCFSLETFNLFGTFLPCGLRTGWMRKLRLLTTSKPAICPTVCTTQFISLRRSFALLHSQRDASIWTEGASVTSCCEFVDKGLCWWSVVHALYASLKGGGNCCCIFLLLQF